MGTINTNNQLGVTTMIKNQYELEQLAKQIAQDAQQESIEFGTDAYDYMHQQCDGHEYVIYTYKAIELCQNCDTDDGEYQLEEIDFKPASFGDYACKLAYATLFQACVYAFDDLPNE